MDALASISGLTVFGGGKMGSAIIEGALKKGLPPEKIRVVDPGSETRAALKARGISAAENSEAFKNTETDIVLAAVKPFVIGEAVESIKPFTDKGAVLLSIVAGRPVSWFEEHLGPQAAVVRAMPNTPAAVGRGMTGLYANARADGIRREKAAALMDACGRTVWLENEAQMDAVTAVSGSGPAYVFYLTEALARAAESLGLSPETAAELARATVCGAAELLYQSPQTPETLRRNVTTPNGTTAAALDILTDERNGLTPLMLQAVKAAEKRSKELASA